MKREVIYAGKYLKLYKYKGWEFVKRNDCSGIVVIAAKTQDGKVIFVEQFRVPLGKKVIELPAGLVGDMCHTRKESMVTAARRELLEETGYKAKRIRFIMEGPVSSGMSAQQIAFFRAEGLTQVSEGGGDETENIKVHAVPLRRAAAWLRQMEKKGRLVDPKVYAGLYFLNETV
jgi:ADP-ribose pyrophosphatase